MTSNHIVNTQTNAFLQNQQTYFLHVRMYFPLPLSFAFLHPLSHSLSLTLSLTLSLSHSLSVFHCFREPSCQCLCHPHILPAETFKYEFTDASSFSYLVLSTGLGLCCCCQFFEIKPCYSSYQKAEESQAVSQSDDMHTLLTSALLSLTLSVLSVTTNLGLSQCKCFVDNGLFFTITDGGNLLFIWECASGFYIAGTLGIWPHNSVPSRHTGVFDQYGHIIAYLVDICRCL